MRKLLLVLIASILATGCDAGGLYIVEYIDGGHGGDGGETGDECDAGLDANDLDRDAMAQTSCPEAPVMDQDASAQCVGVDCPP